MLRLVFSIGAGRYRMTLYFLCQRISYENTNPNIGCEDDDVQFSYILLYFYEDIIITHRYRYKEIESASQNKIFKKKKEFGLALIFLIICETLTL